MEPIEILIHLLLLCEDKVRSSLIGDARTLIESAECSLYLHYFKGCSGTRLKRYPPSDRCLGNQERAAGACHQIRTIQNAIEKAMI